MRGRWGVIAFLAWLAILLAVGLFAGRFYIYITTRIILLSIFAMGYNVLFGRTGLLSFGHASFYAMGAYALALLNLHAIQSPLLGLLVGVLSAALLALIIGFFCVRHTEIYFAMLTLAFGMMVFSLIWNIRSVTGGDDGLYGIMREPISFFGLFEIPLGTDRQFYFLVLVVFAASVWFLRRLARSPFGLILSGIRENDQRMEFAAVNIKNYRLAAFVISGAFAGLAGSLEALLESATSPFMAHWSHSAEPILVTLIGGVGSFAGPLVGSVIFLALREIIERFTENWMLWFGVILLIIIIGFRGGVMGVFSTLTGGDARTSAQGHDDHV